MQCSAYACLQGVDALAVLTEWDEFRALDLVRNKATLAKPFVVDLRNIYPTGTREPRLPLRGGRPRGFGEGRDGRRVVIWALRMERKDGSCALARPQNEENQCGSRYTGWVMWV